MRFADIPGHDSLKARLMACVDQGRIPHAMLIEGCSGIGKFALARATAQYIHCQQRIPGVDSCGKCPSCLQHKTFNHPDTHFTFPVIKRGSSKPTFCADFMQEFNQLLQQSPFMDFEQWLGILENPNTQPVVYVDEANELSRRMSYSAATSAYKIALVWLPERFNQDTANKLLKLIEEPFEDTIFIMASDNPRLILPTIYSRTQRLSAKRYSDDEVAAYLENSYAIDQAEARALAPLAEGSMASALNLISTRKENSLYLDFFMQLMRDSYSRKIASLKQWAADLASLGREREMQFYDYCGRMLRENFMLRMNSADLTRLNPAEMKFSIPFSPFINERNVLKLFNIVNKAKEDISANGNAKLVNFDVAVKVMMLIRS